MQEKNIESYSFAERLKKLRLKRQLTWAALANELELSEPMIYAVLKGTAKLGELSAERLKILEIASGIEPIPEPAPNHLTLRDIPPQEVEDMLSAVDNLRESFHAVERCAQRLKDSHAQPARPPPSSSPDDAARAGAKRGVASVEKSGVRYGRSRKAASTSGKTSSPASRAGEH